MRLQRRTFALSLICVLACEKANNGSGSVEGFFGVRECRRSGDRDPAAFNMDVTFLATRRVQDNLQIVLFEHPVDFEETDGLMLLVNDLDPLLADDTRPLIRPITDDPGGINLALSLFQTCPDRPTLHGVSGTVRFDKLDVAENPEQTGVLEVIAGMVTATVTSADRTSTVGWVRGVFDFLPNKPPLSPAR